MKYLNRFITRTIGLELSFLTRYDSYIQGKTSSLHLVGARYYVKVLSHIRFIPAD